MMLHTGSCLCFALFLLFTLHLSPTLAYYLKHCTILYADNDTAGVSVDCDSNYLISIPDDIPRDTISLTLRENKIQKINSSDFSDLSNLTDLDLSSNAITCVDDEAFFPLVQLKVLRMDHNQLTILTANMFRGLSKLVLLSLFFNDIQCIHPSAFESLTSLQELSLVLTTNQMTDFTTIFQLPSLQVLKIGVDELESFQSKYLPLNMSSALRKLEVISTTIQKFSITTPVFPHLKKITLDIDGWEWDVPDKYFLQNITKLVVYYKVANIKKVLRSLDSLQYLVLIDHNSIEKELLEIACEIKTLTHMGLIRSNRNTTIREIPSQCTQLISLDLSHNFLTELPTHSMKQMKQLSQLILATNYLSKVPDDVKSLSTLQFLDLHSNHINELRCLDFLNLTRLTQLDLRRNYLTELKSCVFDHLNELKFLHLNGNFITSYWDTFRSGLHKLQCLNLTLYYGYLPRRGEFRSLKSLKQLDIQTSAYHPYISGYTFEGLDELESLSLNYNMKMTSSPPLELQRQINDTYSLECLKSFTIELSPEGWDKHIVWGMLSDMKHLENLEVVHGVQPNLEVYVPQLKTLSLRNCHLTTLDAFVAQANLTRLVLLDLSQNELSVINVSVFSFLPALRFINLADNPLACDCSNSDFMQWMHNNNQTQVVGAHSYTCGFPLDKKGTRFLDFDYHSCWVDTSFICFISSTCVVVLTLLTSFTYHFLHLHLLYAYYLFLAFLYDAMERKRGSPQRYDAFISYNVHDELWVYREMLPVLEGEQGWRLCLHHRDFPPGKPIIENITDAIYGSRKVICVISRHYLESEWCSREIQIASYRLFDEQKDVLILVFLEDIPAHQLSPYYHMKRLVKRHTYLSWSQAGQHPGLFWQNLRRALDTPHTDRDP